MTKIFVADVSFLSDNTLFDACIHKLPDHRAQKVNRLRFCKDKILCVGAWLLFKEALNRFDENANTDSFTVYKGGKPYLVDFPDVHFSISHSGTMAMCAVSDQNIGADIQLVCDFREDICQRFFSQCERDYIFKSTDNTQRRKRFFEMWTLKEAYLKMTGRGIGGLSDVEIISAEKLSVKQNGIMKNCHLSTFSLLPYVASVCMEHEDKCKIETVSAKTLCNHIIN